MSEVQANTPFVISEQQKQVLIQAKQRVQTVLDFIKQMEHLKGSNKQSRKAANVMQKFINCHLDSPAIYKRYQEVMLLMERYANNNDTTESSNNDNQ